MKTLAGGCHCKAVRFEVDVDDGAIPLLDCNCSMCSATGFLHLIAAQNAFRLLSGSDNLGEYRFGERIARHLFCKTCGIKSFYVPRSHPDGFSVNARCLDDYGSLTFAIEAFDGRNWEAARERLG